MNEPILTSGFPQVAPEPKPFSLYDKPSEVSANPSRDNAQPFNLTPFTFAVAEKVATAANERMLSYDVMGQALKGKTPMQYFDELGKKAEEAAKVGTQMDNDIADLRAQIASLKPQQADTSGYRAAMGAFDNLAAQAPVAPTLGRLNLTDTDKMMLGFALLTGANPQDAIGNFIKVKQGFVDQNNDQLMGQYKLDATNFNNQIDAAGTRLTNERQLLNDTQQSMDRQYNDTLDSLGQQANQLMMMGRAEESNQIRRHMSAVTEWKNAVKQAEMDGNVTDEEYAQLEGLRVPFLSDRRLDVGLADTLPMPTRGKTTAGIKSDQTDTTISDRRLANDRAAWLNEIKFVNMDGRVTKADVANLVQRAKEFSPDNWQQLPMPVEGVDWKVIKAEADTQLGKDRLVETKRTNIVKEGQGQARIKTSAQKETRLAGSIGKGGDSPAMPSQLPTVSRKEAGRKITLAQGKINALKAKQKLEGDQKKKARYEIEIQSLAAERDYYKEILDGQTVPFNPGEPQSADAQAAAEKARKAAQSLIGGEKQKEGVGIPLSKSYGQGGDKTQYATQNPPSPPKPAESKQDAKKGQSPPKSVNIGDKKFNKTK